jgi:hypothetical protein
MLHAGHVGQERVRTAITVNEYPKACDGASGVALVEPAISRFLTVLTAKAAQERLMTRYCKHRARLLRSSRAMTRLTGKLASWHLKIFPLPGFFGDYRPLFQSSTIESNCEQTWV